MNYILIGEIAVNNNFKTVYYHKKSQYTSKLICETYPEMKAYTW